MKTLCGWGVFAPGTGPWEWDRWALIVLEVGVAEALTPLYVKARVQAASVPC